MAHAEIKVEVEDDHIVVSIPGTSFRATFFKASDEPKLIQSEAMSVEKETPAQSRREFEALAWEAANVKARELGWIV